MNGHRWAVAAESVLLGLPTTLFFLVFGPLMAFGSVQDPSALGLTMTLMIVLSAVALFYFWRLAIAFVLRWGHPTKLWWWGASVGALLVASSVATIGLGEFGIDLPEFLVPLVFGAYGAPLIIPFAHMWLVRSAFTVSEGDA